MKIVKIIDRLDWMHGWMDEIISFSAWQQQPNDLMNNVVEGCPHISVCLLPCF